MPVDQEKLEILHSRLKRFYERSTDYFAEASEVNRVLTPEREHLLSWIAPGSLVLDVGCGPGDNGRFLFGFTRYVGCDLSTLALRLAHEALADCRFSAGESHRLPFANDTFDVVLSTYALEHLVYAQASLEEMWRVCRPGGLVLLISPAYDDPRHLPPSTSHWPRARQGMLVVRQFLRQAVRHFQPGRFYFTCVTQPRVLSGVYESDFDAVHLVSAREIANFFRLTGGEILFERKRAPRPATGGALRTRVSEYLRNVLLNLHLGEYAGLNLQIVVRRPGPASGSPES